jgi:hypothetical protein
MRTFIIEIEGKEVTRFECAAKSWHPVRQIKRKYWYLMGKPYEIYEVIPSKLNRPDFEIGEDKKPSYAKYIRCLRRANNLSIQEVAEEAGICTKRLYWHENGNQKLTLAMLERIDNAITRILDRQESAQTTSVVSTYQKTKRA